MSSRVFLDLDNQRWKVGMMKNKIEITSRGGVEQRGLMTGV